MLTRIRRAVAELAKGAPTQGALLSLGIVGLVGLLSVIILMTFWQAHEARVHEDWVRQTLTLRTRLKDLAITVLSAETGQRGYVLTGRQEFLLPYQSATRVLPTLEDELARLTADEPQQHQQFTRLTGLVHRKMDELADIVRLRTELGEDAARQVILNKAGQLLTVEITATLDEMLGAGERLLGQRHANPDRANEEAERLSIVGTIAATVFLLTAGLVLRRALKRLRESEASFRLLAENASEMVIRVGPDAQLRYISPAAEWVLGLKQDALLGNGLFELVNPEDRPALDASAHRLLTGVANRDEDRIAFRLRRRRGGEVWVDSTARLLRDPTTGTPDGYIAVLHDVTKRQHAEAQLRESEARYRILADSTSDLITWLNLQFERTYVSPAAHAMLGYEPSELIGSTARVVHPDDQAAVQAQLQALASGATSRSQATYRVRHKRGHWVWVETRFSLVRDEETGVPRSIVASVRDVSERMANTELERLARHLARSRDLAEQANRAKSRFLASMSHELRTPLNGILGYAQVLRLGGGLNPTQEGQVQAMLDAGQHLLGMINRVLDFSEIETKKITLEPEPVDPRDLVRTCFEIVRPMADAKHLQLRTEIAEHAPRRAVVDPGRLRQVLLNLLGNAVKFTAAGTIELRLSAASDGGLRIEVIDTGPGIDMDRQHRLFHDFERLDVHAGEGTGLGLAISAGIVEAMGGRIGYLDNVGGGSLFWVELPLALSAVDLVADTPLPSPAPRVTAAIAGGEQFRVLVVDDMEMNREIAGAFLRDVGHTVVFAPGGAEAVEVAAAQDFEAILMDVRMPGVDGLEATRRIRMLPGPRGRVKIIAVTAQSFAEQIRACREAGMDDHLAKPFTQGALLDILGRTVRAEPLPAALAPVPIVPAIAAARPAPASEPPVFDREAFESTAAFLDPDAVATFMQALARQGESLLTSLQDPGALSQASAAAAAAAAAHRFAGSAEMFGFRRAGAEARAFERSVQTAAPDLAGAVDRLRLALESFFAESPLLQFDPTPAVAPRPAPATAAPTDPEPLVFDRTVFEATAGVLDPGAVATYLGVLAKQAEDLLRNLASASSIESGGSALGGTAHRFAGSADMFGFRAAARAARVLERSIQTAAPDLLGDARRLQASIAAALAELRRLEREALLAREPAS